MVQFWKQFFHGLSFGVFRGGIFRNGLPLIGSPKKWVKRFRRFRAKIDSVSDSVEQVLDNANENLDDVLVDMRQDLDDLKKDDVGMLLFLGVMVYAGVASYAVLEFIYQLAGAPLMDATVRQIVVASIGAAGAIMTIPAAYGAMKPGNRKIKGASWFAFLLCAFVAMYMMANTSGQTNSNRIGAQAFSASEATSNTTRLKNKQKDLLALEEKGVTVTGRNRLEQQIRDALKSRNHRGRVLGHITQNCHASRIRYSKDRAACKTIRKVEGRLADKDALVQLVADIKVLKQKVEDGDKGKKDDVFAEVVAPLLGTKKQVVQVYGQMSVAVGYGLILFIMELVYYAIKFDKKKTVRAMERNVRHRESAQKRRQTSPLASPGQPVMQGIVVHRGSVHQQVQSFIGSDLFRVQDGGEIPIPKLAIFYNEWAGGKGFPDMLLGDFKETLNSLMAGNLLKNELVLAQNINGVIVLKGLGKV